MNPFSSEMAELARAMRDFLTAVDVRTELSVTDAVAMLEAWHGPDAAIIAMNQANAAEADSDPIDAAFWLEVYHALLQPIDAEQHSVMIH